MLRNNPDLGRLHLFRLLSVLIMLAALAVTGSLAFSRAPGASAAAPVQPDGAAENEPVSLSAQEPAPSLPPEDTAQPDDPAQRAPEQPAEPQQPDEPEAPPAEEGSEQAAGPEAPDEPDEPETPPVLFTNGAGEPMDYVWGECVAETDPVDDEWFADAAFIGNSLCDGLMLYGNLRGTTFIAAKSISVHNIYSEKCINRGGEYISITDALSRKQYGKIFIMLGINEIASPVERFADGYAALIDYLRDTQPEAEIFVQSLLPVTEKKSGDGSGFTKERILRFNEALQALAAEKQVYYLDVSSALADENGYLPEKESFDGVHLLRPYYERWSDYLRSHSITEVNNDA